MRRAWVLVLAACGGHAGGPSGPPAAPVEVATLEPTTVVDETEYLATLRSRTSATIQPQVDGQIVAIPVKPGQEVERGQPLIRIDAARQAAAVSQARAARASRQAVLSLAEKDLGRVRELVAKGALPRQELDNAVSRVASARADVAASGAEIRSSRVQLGYYDVTAPERGTIGDIPVRVGDRVTTQTVLTTLTDNRTLEANVSVPVGRAAAVHFGTQVRLFDENDGLLATGNVRFVSAQVTPETQSVLVKADIDNSAGKLRAEQVVRARIVWSSHPGVTVPALAVTRQGGQAFVFVVEHPSAGQRSGSGAPAQTIARQRPVTLGALTGDHYVVISGVTAGEQIVTSGLQKLRDGAPIQVGGGPRGPPGSPGSTNAREAPPRAGAHGSGGR